MSALLEVSGLVRRFGGLTAVDHVDIRVDEGQIFGVVGPNGSGKTTLLALISGFLKPDGGRIRFAGADIGGHAPHSLAHRGLVRTFQIVQPFADVSVRDNIVIGALRGGRLSLPEARREAAEVLAFLRFEHAAERPAETLTIADRKKLELARALACRPRLLLLDEVMAGLRPTEVDEAIERIRQIRDRGITIVFVEHLMRAVVALADHLVVMQQGRVIASGGDAREVLQRPAVVAAYFGSEADAAVD